MEEILLGHQYPQERLHKLCQNIRQQQSSRRSPDLMKETLQELRMSCLAIQRHTRCCSATLSTIAQPTAIEAPATKLPQVSTDIQMAGITGTQILAQL